MPGVKKTKEVGMNFVISTYIIGLYGGLVSGLIVSWAIVAPSQTLLWELGVLLAAVGLVLFVIINRLLGKK